MLPEYIDKYIENYISILHYSGSQATIVSEYHPKTVVKHL